MNDRSTFRLSAHQLAWSAVKSLTVDARPRLCGHGLPAVVRPAWSDTTNPNLAFLLSGLAVFALLFARNLAVPCARPSRRLPWWSTRSASTRRCRRARSCAGSRAIGCST